MARIQLNTPTIVAYTFAIYQLKINRFRKSKQKEEARYGKPCRQATYGSQGSGKAVLYARVLSSVVEASIYRR